MNICEPEDIFSAFEEQRKIDEEYNEIVSSSPFHDFYTKYRLVFIGYDYYLPQYKGEKVYTFQDIDGNYIKVFNILGVSIGQILLQENLFSVIKRRTGFYEFFNNSCLNSNKEIIPSFEDEWLEYEEVKEKLESIAERKRRVIEVQKQQERNANRFPYDLSGDDLSLDPNMW